MTTDEGRAAIADAAHAMVAGMLDTTRHSAIEPTKMRRQFFAIIDATIALARAEGARDALKPLWGLGVIRHQRLKEAEAEVNACQDRLREASG